MQQPQKARVYLIPTVLQEDEQALKAIPSYIVEAIRECNVFFVENEKTARRYFKKLWKEMVIDDYKWYTIHKAESEVSAAFVQHLKEHKTIGIVSEAGCPGIADPGQVLIALAQKHGALVQPLVGPSSLLLALMASGMNGQRFSFHGYLPIDGHERKKAIKEIEANSQATGSAHIFIETPYRNNQVIADVLNSCKPATRFCIAVDLTAGTEQVRSKTIADWKKDTPDFHKRPAIFLLQA